MKLNFYRTGLITLALWGCPKLALAQIVPAANDAGSRVQASPTTPNQVDIIGGTQAGPNLFHGFQQFDLGVGQIANFQSNPTIQNILSRVVGGNPSSINGLIQVTGGNSNLFLINPAGIIFGANANLNVPAAFTATTANGVGVGNSWFNAVGSNNYSQLGGNPNQLAFTTLLPGAIVNAGNLTIGQGQSLTLVGGTVINTGTIAAPGGIVTIAAVPGENLVRISEPGSLLSLALPLATKGAINAPGLPVSLPELLTGSGLSNATGVTVKDGVVRLTASGMAIPTQPGVAVVSNQVDVSGVTGGRVDVFGKTVGVVDATINASGLNGGGQVRIGGDYQGKGTVPNATRTVVNANSQIQVDAIAQGNGGRVIAWADDTTSFTGKISARGGSQSGNGGFVEVSGKQNLAYAGTVDLQAPQGQGGQLLLDPSTVVIGTTTTNDNQLSDQQILAGDSGNANFAISANGLENALNIGNVSIAASNAITINSDVFSIFNTNTFNLTLNAPTITLSNGIFLDVKGDLTLQGQTINLQSTSFTEANGNLLLNATNQLTATNAQIKSGNDLQLQSPNLILQNSSRLNAVRDLTITGQSFDIPSSASSGNQLTAGRDLNLQAQTATLRSTIDATRNVNIDVSNQLTLSSVNLTAGQTLNINQGIPTPGQIIYGSLGPGQATAGGNINLAASTITTVSSGNSDRLTLKATGNLQVQTQGDLSLNRFGLNADGNATVQSLTDSIILPPFSFFPVPDVKGTLTLQAPQDIKLTQGQLTSTQSLSLQAGRDIILDQTQLKTTSPTADVTLVAGRSLQANDNFQANGAGAVIIQAGRDLRLQGTQDVTIQAAKNPASIFQSGNNLTLASDGLIIANAKFVSGGSFITRRVADANPATINQTVPSFNSVISAGGDVTFGNYEGLSLKVEAKGSITGGNITILGANATLSGPDPDIAQLKTRPLLILNAGVSALTNAPNTPQSPGGTTFTTSATPAAGKITVGDIKIAAPSLPGDQTPLQGTILTATSGITTGDVLLTGGSITLSTTTGDLTTGRLSTGGLDIAKNSSIKINANAGNVTVQTIDTGAGGLDVTALGTFQALGSAKLNGGTFQNESFVVKDNPALIDFLLANVPGVTRAQLEASTTRINVDTQDFPVSIIARPSNISDPNNARIVIRHGGVTVGNAADRIQVQGTGGAIGFKSGPIVTKQGTGFAALTTSDDVSTFDLTIPLQTFKLKRAELYQPLSGLSSNTTGTVGGIIVGAGSNSDLYASFRDRAFDAPPPKPDPGGGGNGGGSSGGSGEGGSGGNNGDVTRGSNPTATVDRQNNQATCAPSSTLAAAPAGATRNNAADQPAPNTAAGCKPLEDDATILKILEEPKPTSQNPSEDLSQTLAQHSQRIQPHLARATAFRLPLTAPERFAPQLSR
jgi:filamentous hemagglutinin family protein